jgi:hypothetical protein
MGSCISQKTKPKEDSKHELILLNKKSYRELRAELNEQKAISAPVLKLQTNLAYLKRVLRYQKKSFRQVGTEKQLNCVH